MTGETRLWKSYKSQSGSWKSLGFLVTATFIVCSYTNDKSIRCFARTRSQRRHPLLKPRGIPEHPEVPPATRSAKIKIEIKPPTMTVDVIIFLFHKSDDVPANP